MNDVKVMQQVLASKILELCCDDKISKRIELMTYTLETIEYLKKNQIEETELATLKELIKEALLYGANERVSMSNHYKKLDRLTKEIKKELTNNSLLIEEEPIPDLNSLIKSLKIFKISNRYNELEEKTYQNSYELYQAMRKIILKKNSTKCKRIYVGMIVEKLEEKTKQLPTNTQIYESDYELFQIIKLVRNSPEFGYGHKSIGILSNNLRHRLERHSNILRVKMLIK